MSQPVARDTLCRVYLGNNFRYETNVGPPPPIETKPPGTFPTIIYTSYNMPKQIQWMPNQPVPSGLRFQVYDDNGIALNEVFDFAYEGSTGVPEADWSMTILVSEN